MNNAMGPAKKTQHQKKQRTQTQMQLLCKRTLNLIGKHKVFETFPW